MSTLQGLLLTLAVAWAVAIACYLIAHDIRVKDLKFWAPLTPDIESKLWDRLKRQDRTMRQTKVVRMSNRWIDERKRKALP